MSKSFRFRQLLIFMGTSVLTSSGFEPETSSGLLPMVVVEGHSLCFSTLSIRDGALPVNVKVISVSVIFMGTSVLL